MGMGALGLELLDTILVYLAEAGISMGGWIGLMMTMTNKVQYEPNTFSPYENFLACSRTRMPALVTSLLA
jgi:hypothetical protein